MTRCPSRAQRVRPAFSTTPTISWPGTSSPRVSYALSSNPCQWLRTDRDGTAQLRRGPGVLVLPAPKQAAGSDVTPAVRPQAKLVSTDPYQEEA